jgi:NADH:ubiquinone reductase (H+-translocating)
MVLPGVPGVYVVGDYAHFQDTKSGQIASPRAHIAVREAKTVAHNVLAEIRGREMGKYRYSNAAEAVSLGSTNAAVRFYWLRLYGFPTIIMWLVGYSSLVTGVANRVRIIMGWLLSSLFG